MVILDLQDVGLAINPASLLYEDIFPYYHRTPYVSQLDCSLIVNPRQKCVSSKAVERLLGKNSNVKQ